MTREIGALPTPSTYTRLMLQRWPAMAAALLHGSGLSEATLAASPSITVAQQLQVFRNARDLAGRPEWALDFGRQLNINSHGPLGFAALSAPTLGEGLDVFGRFARIRSPFLDFDSIQTDQHIALTVDTTLYPLGDLALPIIEIILQIAVSYIDAVIGADAGGMLLCLRQGPPAHAASYPDYFRARYEFNAAFDGVALPVSLKALPCPLRDEKTFSASLLRCREALDAVLSPDDVVARASHWLAAHYDQIAARGKATTQPHLDDLASALCVSPRTLNRQFALKGTSFSELRAAHQLEVACKMLGDARFTANDIGILLGYGDAANFGRAFKRMTGRSPGHYRRG